MTMHEEMDERFSKMASLIGEKGRAKMLWHLLDGRAYTALELAIVADISKQSCSNHLKKLVVEKILNVEKQGRHKYFKLYDAHVATALEGLASLTSQKLMTSKDSSDNKLTSGIKYARSCYDHLAGYIGVLVHESLLEQGYIIKKDQQYYCTNAGLSKFEEIGIDIETVNKRKRKFAYPCLDWSERKHHVGGALGAVLLAFMKDNHWFREKKNSRELVLNSKGRQALERVFKVVV